MMYRNSLLSLLTFVFALPFAPAAQTRLPENLPDSITILDNVWNLARSYSCHYTFVREEDGYSVVRNSSSFSQGRHHSNATGPETVGGVTNADIRRLIRAINDTGFSELRIGDLGVDSDWIARHSDKLFSYVKRQYDNWTPRQTAFAKKELGDYSNYDPAARRSILQEGFSYLFKDFALQFQLQCYYKGDTALAVSASENYLGLPWQVGNRLSYNPGISRAIVALLPEDPSGNLPRLKGGHLLQILARQVYEDNISPELPNLAVLEYTSYINELRKDFTVLGAAETSFDWIEFKHYPQTFRFTLGHPSLHPGIQLLFYSVRMGHSLYPPDSLREAFPRLRDRTQHVKFLMDYLDGDPNRKINLFFFNDLAISRSHIAEFNQDSTHWKLHDAWVKDMAIYQTGKVKPDFDVAESIETSKRVECGCNFRLNNDWLWQSILFEVRDEYGNSSTWVLLPDNTPVLWHFQGDSVYKYSYKDLGTNGRSVQYPCRKLDAEGNLVQEGKQP
jgi:hypothetical protein